jgi:hypothetical protein
VALVAAPWLIIDAEVHLGRSEPTSNSCPGLNNLPSWTVLLRRVAEVALLNRCLYAATVTRSPMERYVKAT